MSALPHIIQEPHEVDAELAKLGLEVRVLMDALNDGDEARTMTTANDPPMYGGITFWAVAVRSLRGNLLAGRWEKSDAGNYSVVVSPDGRHQIAVSSGNEDTGLRNGKQPKTRNPKGPATSKAIQNNRDQLSFVEELGLRVHAQPASDVLTWIFLFHDAGSEIRSELSLPRVLDDELRASEWEMRIILPRIDRDGHEPRRRTDDHSPAPDMDVPIQRRTG